MAEFWNSAFNKLLNFCPKRNFNNKSHSYTKNEKSKIYFEKVANKILGSLQTYEDRASLIHSIQEYNWTSIQKIFRRPRCWVIDALLNVILELGVDVAKIKIEGYGSCGFFIFIRSNTNYFDIKDYNILEKRINYFKQVILKDVDLDFSRRNLFHMDAFRNNKLYIKVLLNMEIDLIKYINYATYPSHFFKFTLMEYFCLYYEEKNKHVSGIQKFLQLMITTDRNLNILPLTEKEKENYASFFQKQKQRGDKILQLLKCKITSDLSKLIVSYILN